MADLGFVYKPGQVEAFSDFTPTPKGKFHAIICKDEIDMTDKDRPLLKLTFRVIEGPNIGDEVEEAFAIWTPDDGSKSGGWGKVSRRKMESILLAIGQTADFPNSSVLQNRPMLIETDLEFKLKNDGSGKWNTYTRLKTYKRYVGQNQAPGADPVQPQPPVAAAPVAGAPTLPSAPGMPMAAPRGFAMPAAPVAPVQQQFAAPVQLTPAQGQFAPPMAPAQQFPGAPGQPVAPFQPPYAGAPAPFAPAGQAPQGFQFPPQR